jgi:hypothetical protein
VAADPDGDTLTYKWTVRELPSGPNHFNDSVQPNPFSINWASIPGVASGKQYQVSCKVTDGKSSDVSAPDKVTVTIWTGWGRHWGASGSEEVHAVAMDSEDNVYVIGWYNTAGFTPPGGSAFTTPVGNDIFVIEYDKMGAWVWQSRIYGTGSEQPYGVGVNPVDGALWVFGHSSSGSVSVEGSPLTGTSHGGWDDFIVRYDSAHTVIMVGTIGSSGDEQASFEADIQFDSAGNAYLSGQGGNGYTTFDLDPSPTGNSSTPKYSGWDAFVVKLDKDGAYGTPGTWGGVIGGNDQDTARSGLCVGSDGFVYVTGECVGSVDLDPSSGTYPMTTSNGSMDVFLARIRQSDGTMSGGGWGILVGGSGSEEAYGGVAVDNSTNPGKVYVSGVYSSTFSFDGSHTAILKGPKDFFIGCYSTADGNCINGWGWGSTGDDFLGGSHLSPQGIYCDPTNGDLYYCGAVAQQATGTIDFDPDAPGIWTLTNSSPGSDGFIVKRNSSGDIQWIRQLENSTGNILNGSIYMRDGILVYSGFITGATDFDLSAGVDIHTPISQDAFLIAANASTGLW